MSCCAITNQLPPRAFLASTCLTLLFALTAVTVAQASSRAPLAPDSPSIPPSLSAVPLRSSFQPNSVWSPSIPYAVVCASGYLFVAVTAVRYPNLILQLNATTHSTLLTTSLTPPTLAVLNLVASTTSLFALTYDTTSYLTHSITQLSLTHLTPIRILSLGRSPSLLPLHLLGVDPAGSTLALALHLSPAVTRIDVATGRTLPPLTGNRSLQILGGAVDPLTGHVVIADRTSLSVLALTQDNATAWATQLPPSYTPDLSTCLASDAAGGYVYALFSTASPPCYSFTQYNLSTGAVVGEDCVDVEAITPQQQISAGAAHGEVWFVDVIGLSVNAEVSGRVSGFTVGQHPYLEDPAAIAVAGDGGVERVYVGVGQGVAELDAAGALVGMLWTENDHCTYSMLADVAVDAVGNVYAPICNGTIAVFSSQRVLLRSINLGSGVVPSSVSPSADGTSAYVKDDVHATRLSLYDLTSGKIMRTLSAESGSVLARVEVDWTNGSVWATDSKGGCIYHWAADGSLLSVWNYTTQATIRSLFDVAVDHAHGRLLVTEQVFDEWGLDRVRVELLWLDLHLGTMLGSFTFPDSEMATGVAVTASGATLYGASINTCTVFGSVYVFHTNASSAAPTSGPRMPNGATPPTGGRRRDDFDA